MFNNSLFDEEARLKIAEREREAETYGLHDQFGYSSRGAVRWFFGLLMLISALILILILL
jgi:hypothetical protein